MSDWRATDHGEILFDGEIRRCCALVRKRMRACYFSSGVITDMNDNVVAQHAPLLPVRCCCQWMAKPPPFRWVWRATLIMFDEPLCCNQYHGRGADARALKTVWKFHDGSTRGQNAACCAESIARTSASGRRSDIECSPSARFRRRSSPLTLSE